MPNNIKILEIFKYLKYLKTDAQPPPLFQHRTKNSLKDDEDTNIDNKEEQKDKKSNSESSKNKDKTYNLSPPSTPIQGGGNVINIVNSNHVHVGSVITNNTAHGTAADESDTQEQAVVRTPAIDALLESQLKPQHVHLECVSRNLGRRWKGFFRSVGYSNGHIDTLKEQEAAYGIQEVRYKLLLDWKQNDEEGTLGALASALWDYNERDVVRLLSCITDGA